jgi:hypothetical protein
MTIPHLNALLVEAEKLALVKVLHSHPEWTLGCVLAYAHEGGPRSAVLLGLTFRELLTDPDVLLEIPEDGGPVVDAGRLERARQAKGLDFDEYVHAVLVEAGGPVGAAYLRARLGGPRWKLLGSLRRLQEADRIDRSGVTSSTQYSSTEPEDIRDAG